MRRQTKILLLILTLISIFATYTPGQNPDAVVQVNTNLVQVNVIVRDEKGKLVKGLSSSNFDIYQDNEKQPIAAFSSDNGAISVGVIYDAHPEIEGCNKAVLESLQQLRTTFSGSDDIFLSAFNLRGEQTFDFVPSIDQFQRHIGNPGNKKIYSLYDAIYAGTNALNLRRNPTKVLIVLSDSADHNSRHTTSEVSKNLVQNKIEAYAVIFDENEQSGPIGLLIRPVFRNASTPERVAMQDVVNKAGGYAFFVDPTDTPRLSAIYQEILEEMRARYSIGYYVDAIDDKRHTIRIRLRDVQKSGKYTLTYRQSYQNGKSHWVNEEQR
jgi:VWFA-related protein